LEWELRWFHHNRGRLAFESATGQTSLADGERQQRRERGLAHRHNEHELVPGDGYPVSDADTGTETYAVTSGAPNASAAAESVIAASSVGDHSSRGLRHG